MRNSLRWRLQAWHALILFLVVAGFGSVLYLEVRRSKFDEIDAELLAGARVLEGVLRTSPRNPDDGPRRRDDRPDPEARAGRPFRPRDDGSPPPPPPPPPPPRKDGRRPGGPPPRRKARPDDALARDDEPFTPGQLDGRIGLALALPLSLEERYEEDGQTPYFVVRDDDRNVLRASENARSVPPDDVWPGDETHARRRGDLREVTLMGPRKTRITVGRSIGKELGGLRRLGWQLGLTGFGVFTAGLVGGWWLSGRAVKPIETMSATVAGISARSLSRRIDLEGVDTELGTLGGLLNVMLDRLEASFAQQVRFTADASHELRTPLTIIATHVELALTRPRQPSDYQDALRTCGRAAGRMASLVDDLLTLARADSGKLELRAEQVDLAAVVKETSGMLRPLAAERGVSLRLETVPTWLSADPHRLAQVVTNLLNNAIVYNRPGGLVTLSVFASGDEAVLRVADTGVGIPEPDRPFLFDRFYRVDKARSRDSGGSGLGLAICKSVVDAHGGTLTLSSELGTGTTFDVRLPRPVGVEADVG